MGLSHNLSKPQKCSVLTFGFYFLGAQKEQGQPHPASPSLLIGKERQTWISSFIPSTASSLEGMMVHWGTPIPPLQFTLLQDTLAHLTQ